MYYKVEYIEPIITIDSIIFVIDLDLSKIKPCEDKIREFRLF